MTLPIQTGTDNPILRTKSEPIQKVDKRVKKLVKDMTETMLKKDGVGLAAPQVGVNERLVILNFQISEKEWRPIALVNPVLVDASVAMETAEEGCLSLSGVFGPVTRHREVTVRFIDESGSERVLQLAGINARAAQHEIDHLDAVLFVDRLEGGPHQPNPVAL